MYQSLLFEALQIQVGNKLALGSLHLLWVGGLEVLGPDRRLPLGVYYLQPVLTLGR